MRILSSKKDVKSGNFACINERLPLMTPDQHVSLADILIRMFEDEQYGLLRWAVTKELESNSESYTSDPSLLTF